MINIFFPAYAVQSGQCLKIPSTAHCGATRLAALFHVFDDGVGAISEDAFERASAIVAWHLNESRRFFGEIALPAEIANAARLNDWLVQHCRQNKSTM